MSILIGLISCNEETSDVYHEEHKDNKVDKRTVKLFTDVIPENVPDSTKVDMIDQLISVIDKDSSLIEVKTVDSLEIPIVGFFRNDSLVKIIKGTYPGVKFDTRFSALGYRYSVYYFLMDSLIHSRYECNSYQQTGRCNPVFISVDSYYYNRQIISEIVDDQIGPYWSCGCGMPPKVIDQIEKKSRESINYEYIDELKEIINTANKP